MQIKTRITELFEISYPIVLGGLQQLGLAPLAAAVSNAGGLGLVTANCFETCQGLQNELETLKSLTKKPFGVNISISRRLPTSDFVDCVKDMQVPIIFSSGNNPEPFMQRLHDSKATLVHVVSSLRHAKTAQQLGYHAIVVVGFEAGGHPGIDDVGLSVLVRKTVDTIPLPVIASGAISDSRALVAALAWGAEGVQVGTRFMMTKECILHDNAKQRLLQAQSTDTLVIERSLGGARRVLRTAPAEKVLEMEKCGANFDELKPIIGGQTYKEVVFQGRLDKGVLSTGQCIGLIDDIPTVSQLLSSYVNGVTKVIDRLDNILGRTNNTSQ